MWKNTTGRPDLAGYDCFVFSSKHGHVPGKNGSTPTIEGGSQTTSRHLTSAEALFSSVQTCSNIFYVTNTTWFMVCSMSFNREALGIILRKLYKVFMGLNQETTNMICFADMAWIDLGTCWSSPNQKETRQDNPDFAGICQKDWILGNVHIDPHFRSTITSGKW